MSEVHCISSMVSKRIGNVGYIPYYSKMKNSCGFTFVVIHNRVVLHCWLSDDIHDGIIW